MRFLSRASLVAEVLDSTGCASAKQPFNGNCSRHPVKIVKRRAAARTIAQRHKPDPHDSRLAQLALYQGCGTVGALLQARVLVNADVAIIGAGLAGLGTAYWLRQAGVRVVVLERDNQIGQRASGGSAAMGRQLHDDDAVTELAVAGASWLRHSPIPGAWVPTGGILGFADEVARARIIDCAHKYAVPVAPRTITAAAWQAPCEFALHIPSDGLIGIAPLLTAWAADIEVQVKTEVISASPTPAGVRIETTRGPIVTRIVVNAAGAWADTVGQRLGATPRTRPTLRHVSSYAAAATGPYHWHTGPARGHYVRPVAGAVWLSACDEVACPSDAPVSATIDATPDAHEVARIEALARALAAKPVHLRSWVCTRTFARSGAPCLIEFDDHVPQLLWVAALGAHGATAAPEIGRRAAKRIMSRLDAPSYLKW